VASSTVAPNTLKTLFQNERVPLPALVLITADGTLREARFGLNGKLRQTLLGLAHRDFLKGALPQKHGQILPKAPPAETTAGTGGAPMGGPGAGSGTGARGEVLGPPSGQGTGSGTGPGTVSTPGQSSIATPKPGSVASANDQNALPPPELDTKRVHVGPPLPAQAPAPPPNGPGPSLGPPPGPSTIGRGSGKTSEGLKPPPTGFKPPPGPGNPNRANNIPPPPQNGSVPVGADSSKPSP
jgi:hypothetical protein